MQLCTHKNIKYANMQKFIPICGNAETILDMQYAIMQIKNSPICGYAETPQAALNIRSSNKFIDWPGSYPSSPRVKGVDYLNL